MFSLPEQAGTDSRTTDKAKICEFRNRLDAALPRCCWPSNEGTAMIAGFGNPT